ncbi:P-loop containing nucleoside triphosphate hydrolase protein [Coemansia reversa NRRL 1564]|uniref:P-loop containing nucleoside triphosphate hydrolase protein n=1 Tax=Coemansia reversa (strain ATCC 12441 / NRRL 1564) TaxID=763665 RepID=A0A2G5BLI2_COERN|nr:P-loop containing nucleoside triphosphate hydrolase protein [Coemansia reversa NRRL 1564]|eukprot:PIA19607.1 P-loop containing nucleoside triphosphate hydrolase protein [Coemansia reversa NRRL 1564]
MFTLESLLAAVPVSVRDSLDQDTRVYLSSIIEADSDPSALREAAEPFLADAGMDEAELAAVFSKLSIDSTSAVPELSSSNAAGSGPVLLPKEIKSAKALTQAKIAKVKEPAVQAFSQQSRFHTETVTTLSNDVDLKGVNVIVDDHELLVDARLWLKAGYHYGMVGRNGAGKSTLLSVIGNHSLVGLPENIRTLYIQQLDVLESDVSVLDSVLAADEERQKRIVDANAIEVSLQNPETLHQALEKYIHRISSEQTLKAQKIATLRSGKRGKNARAVALKAENTMLANVREKLYVGGKTDSEVAADVLTTLYAELDTMNAHSAEAKARTILGSMDITEAQQNGPVSKLSGGWRMRVALAKAMFLEPDVLLLDECTNHLDLAAIAWLQDYLVALEDITIVCVSHDRDFLNAVSQETIRLKEKQLTYHPGNYDEYEQTEDELRRKKERQYASLERRREHVKKSIDGFMKHARSTNDSKVLSQVASRKKKLERLAGLDKLEDGKRFKLSYWAGFHETMRPELKLERPEKGVDFSIPQPENLRHYGPLISLNNVSFAYGNGGDRGRKILDNIDLNVMMGDHIALLGLNGCGKSTLIGIINGTLVPNKGNIERQVRLRIGHYTQHFVDELSGVYESGLARLMSIAPGTKESEARKWLGSFELSGPLATRPICTLSGGQRARMAMAIMLHSNPHMLLLDEATNHLDMYAVQGLVAAINEYEGTVIVVSHDRHFIRETADDSYVLQDGKLTLLEDGVDAYVQQLALPVIQ